MTFPVEHVGVVVVVLHDMVFALRSLEKGRQTISWRPAEDGAVLVWTCVHCNVGVLFVVVVDLPWLPPFFSESLHRSESSVVVGMLNGFSEGRLALSRRINLLRA